MPHGAYLLKGQGEKLRHEDQVELHISDLYAVLRKITTSLITHLQIDVDTLSRQQDLAWGEPGWLSGKPVCFSRPDSDISYDSAMPSHGTMRSRNWTMHCMVI